MEPDIEVIAPDGTVIQFPAGTPDEEIVRVMQENFGGPEDAAFYAEPGMTENNPIDLAAIDRSTPEGQALVASLTRGTWVKGADGTVYALPDDAREGVVRTGDEPLSPGLLQRPQSGFEDVAKSFPTGVVEGLTGLAGMQGTIGQMLGGEVGQNLPGFGIVGPTGEQLNDQIREGLGRDYYQPQGVAGEYSRTAGEFLPGVVAPGGVGAKLASWLVPAVASETAGQGARALEGGERGTTAEMLARLVGGVGGGLGVGGVNAVRSGADNVLRGAAEGVTPDQLAMAAALRGRSPVPLTNAEALQQVTGGATGMGRVQRVVEGASPRLAPMMADRPARVDQAIGGVLDQIGPSVEPSRLAPQVREASGGVLNTLRRRANEDAGPFYRNLPSQSIPADDYARLAENPSYQAALRSVRGDPEIAPLIEDPFSVGPVYHGTPDARGLSEGFKTPQELYGVADDSRAFWFTDDPSVAKTYADPARAWDYQNAEPGVLEARLRLQNPLEVEGNGQRWSGTAGTLDEARAGGNDSVVVRNSVDDYTGQGGTSTVYSVFDPQNIRLGPAPGDRGLQVVNEVVKQLDTMADEAAPNSMRVGGSNTRAAQRREAQALADALAREASPDYGMARDTVRGINEAFINPLKAGPIGALADTSEAAPNLGAMTSRLFPSQPFEGQAAETSQALRLMGEVDPSVPGPLVRQFLAQQAAEAGQANIGGANPFGGAKFAAQTFGNPLQRETVLGAVDAAAPMASRDIRDLVEALSATGQREAAGSNTSFNSAFLNKLEDGGVLDQAASLFTDPLGTPRRIQSSIRDWTAERNAQSLADLLVANSDEFSARLTRAINRPRGANRIRAGVAIGAGQED